MVSDPRHYEGNGTIKCRDALASMMAHADVPAEACYYWGCAFKYIWRWHMKDGLQDLYKCRQCIDMLIETLER